MITFIDDHRTHWGVEPICRVLPIAPSTYYAAKKRAPSQRTLRDEYLKVQIERVWKANFKVYGADKIWVALTARRSKWLAARSSASCATRASEAPRGAARSSPLSLPTTAPPTPPTSCSGTSAPRLPIACGFETSRMSRRTPAWSISLSSSTASHG